MQNGDREKLQANRKSLEKSLSQLLGATNTLLAPLRTLTPEQKDAVATLGLLIHGVSLARRPSMMLGEGIFTRLKREIDEICPPLGKVVLERDPCLEATVAYISALKECEEEGKSEEECPKAWGPGAQAVMCAMNRIEGIRGDITSMLRRQRPPKPIPWPT